MQCTYDLRQAHEQEAHTVSQERAQELALFLLPLFPVLETLLDKRLVRTVVQWCVAVIRFRNTKQGLRLRE
jgi:hypothetical protein